MGTRSMIGIYNATDGSVNASYCHFDGYVEGVGKTLVEHYNTQYDAEVVAKGGYLSSLESDYLLSRQGSVHADPFITFDSVTEFMTDCYDMFNAEYLYLWDGEAWFVSSVHDEPRFEELEYVLKKVSQTG